MRVVRGRGRVDSKEEYVLQPWYASSHHWATHVQQSLQTLPYCVGSLLL